MKKLSVFLLCLNVLLKVSGQVNFQTGSATHSIPIFGWEDHKSRLASIISLDYNSGNGLKAGDVASNVGQGWNLMAGGVITRMQNGEPDDQKPYNIGSSETWDDTKKYPAGYLYASFDITKGVSTSINQYPLFKAKNVVYKQFNDVAADKELDRFAFSFNGRSGVFVLDKTTNKGLLLEDSRIKIWFVKNENNSSQQIRTTIVTFYIQDENGSIYKFSKFSKTKILKTNYCNPELTQALTQPNFKNDRTYYESAFEDAQIVNPYIINEWYLEEIEDALTHRKITFTYVNRSIDAKAGIAITHYNNVGDKNYSVVSYGRSKTETPELSTIVWPDGYQLTLNYGQARVDMNGSYAMNSIDIKYAGRVSSRYELTTSYFIRNRIGTPKTVYQKNNARLCLLSVKKILPDLKGDEPPCVFSYYMGSSAPDDVVPAPFTHLKDIWGFYNGSNSKDFNNAVFPILNDVSMLNNSQLKGLCFLRNGSNDPALNPKDGYAKNGLLKQIIYPAGGSIKYEYEQNTAVMVGQSGQGMVGGVHVSKTSVADGGFSNDCNNALITHYKYTLDDAYTQSSLWGVEVPKNSMTVLSHYSPADKYFYYKPIFDMGCKYRYQNPGILSRDQAIDLTGRQKFLLALSGVMSVVSAVTQVFDIISVCMSATPAAIVAIVLDVIGTVVNIVLTCFTDPSDNSTTHMYYNSDVNGSNALPSQFSRVETKEGSGANGRTVMEFTSSADYAIWEPTNPTYSMKQRFAPYAYGLEKKTTVYDAGNNKVKEIENTYDYSNAKWVQHFTYHHPPILEIRNFPSCKYLVKKSVSKRSDEWTNPNNHLYPLTYFNTSNSDILVDIYDPIVGRVELETSYERTYKPGQSVEFVQTKKDYWYSDVNYAVSMTQTFGSDGTIYWTYYKYNSDFVDYPGVSMGTLNNLTSNNIYNELVSVSNWIKDPLAGGQYMLNEKVTEFQVLANGDVRPYRTLEQKFAKPQLAYEITTTALMYPGPAYATIWGAYAYPAPYTAPNFNYKETERFYYDNASNLIGIKDEGGRTVKHIYDYDDRHIAATITNVDPVNDVCAYSSFETSSFGGFTYTGAGPNYALAGKSTGKRCLVLSNSRSLSININPSKRYRLTFYGAGTMAAVSNATLQSTYFNPATTFYFEYLTNPGATSITITGATASASSKVDELRLYPIEGRMKTVTMDPLVGKLSDADENTRITSYEYDNNSRLRYIKDDNGVIVKMYEYNFSKKPACPVTYTHLEVSETFTKNNCGAGTIGSDVTYTIPAGTYTSTHSQEAVDAMVDNDLEMNGQNHANSAGSCIPVFYNDAKATNFSKEDCPLGYIGSTVTYSVPANRYRSFVDKADANRMAQEEIDANGQAWANTPGVSSCIINTTAQWEGTGCTQCVNNQNSVQVRDINPNSATYGQTQWVQTTDPCVAAPTPFYALVSYDNYYYYSDPYYTIEQADFYISFYENAAYTIPHYATGESIINYSLSTTEQSPYGQDNHYYEYYVKPAAGAQQIVLGNLRTYEFWILGFEQFANYANYTLLEGCHYNY
ncbi:MAG: hypothetical protein H7Y86_02510 [Rhizobacter sp.]|nr:hypothetical protein [Ferruginibacter sp.]